MTPTALLLLAAVGTAVGFVSGLLGIGGGVLIVPFLYFFYGTAALGGGSVSPELEVAVAHATSLFIIVPTAVVGTVSYTRAGLVAWRVALPVAGFSLLAAALGARLALALPGDALRLGFGIFLLYTAAQLVLPSAAAANEPLRLGAAIVVPTGIAVGLLSALLGVGGGIVLIPLLLRVIRLDIARVASTSLAVVAAAAAAGTLSYMAGGWETPGRPPGSIGYVHVYAALPILAGSVLTVRLGTAVNQRMPRRALRWTFAALFLVLGVRLVVSAGGRLLG